MKKIILMVVVLSVGSWVWANSPINLEWQVDTTSYNSEISLVYDIANFSDGYVGVMSKLGTEWSTNGYNEFSVAVLDPAGNFKAEFTLSSYYLYYPEFTGISTSSKLFYINTVDPYICSYADGAISYTNLATSVTNWSNLAQNGGGVASALYISDGTVVKRYRMGDAAVKVAGTAAAGMSGENFTLSWKSQVGVVYQIQSSTDLSAWIDVGSPLTGTGSEMTWANAVTTNKFFYRVKIQ
jgi:hypothetical protein